MVIHQCQKAKPFRVELHGEIPYEDEEDEVWGWRLFFGPWEIESTLFRYCPWCGVSLRLVARDTLHPPGLHSTLANTLSPRAIDSLRPKLQPPTD